MGQAMPTKRSFIDAFWRAFASVRLGIVLMILIAVTAIFGSLITQEGEYASSLPPEIFYPLEYGTYGEIMYTLGLTRMYTSWWFLALLLVTAINLIITSVDRFIPLWKSLQNPQVVRSPRFIMARQVHHVIETAQPPEEALPQVVAILKRKGFKVRTEGADAAYGDKGRLGRFGAYVTHVGLIVLLVAAVCMAIPGWYHDQFFWVPEGETVAVPHTDFFVRNDSFHVEFHEDGRPSLFQTDAVILRDGAEVHSHAIRVNNPLVFDRVSLFQASWQVVLGKTGFTMMRHDAEPVVVGELLIDVQNPARSYPVSDDTTVRLLNYFPEFDIDPVEGPVSLSSDPVNPVFVLEIEREGAEPVRHMLFVLDPSFMLPGLESPYRFTLSELEIQRHSGLVSHRNLAIPYIYLGMGIAVLGVFLSFYLYHRRLWVRMQDGKLYLGAMCNKHLNNLRREMERLHAEIGRALHPADLP